MVRLAEAAGKDWDELNQAMVKDKALRGRLFGVLGSSLALGDHLVANPQSWHLLAGDVTLPSADELRTELHRGRRIGKWHKRCAARYADALPRPAAGARRTGPRVGRGERAGAAVHRDRRASVGSGRCRAGRRAEGGDALGVRRGRRAAAAGGDRDGQVRRPRAELRQRRRRHLRRRRGRLGHHEGGRRDDAVRVGGVLRGRRGAAAGGQARSAGADAGLARRLLPALGQDLGVPGADEGAARGRRRGAGRAVHRRADADGVDGVRARGLRARGAGDAPPRRGAGARRGAGPGAQARHRRAARRRVRRAAAAAGARPQRRVAACGVDGRRAGRARVRAGTSAATTPPT